MSIDGLQVPICTIRFFLSRTRAAKICFLVPCVFLLSRPAEAQSFSGEKTQSPAECAFSKVSWSVDYRISFNRGEDGGTVRVSFSNGRLNVPSDAIFRLDGKSYTPADAGFSQWPQYQSSYGLTIDFELYYKGEYISTFRSIAASREAVLGRFNNYDKGGKLETKQAFLGGSKKVYLSEFNLSDISLRAAGINGACAGDAPAVSAALKQKQSRAAAGSSSGSSSGSAVSIASNNSYSANKTSSSASSSGSSLTPSSTSRTGSSSGSYYSSSGNVQQSSNQLQQQRDQAVTQLAEHTVNLASSIIGDIREARERKAAMRERQRLADSIKEHEKIEARYNENKRHLDGVTNQNIGKANAGDITARLTIIEEVIRFGGRWSLGQMHRQWLDEAVENEHMKAILYKAYLKDDIGLYRRAADMGSLDAMAILADHYNKWMKTADSALFFFEKAAMGGCPESAYFLGMIYLYGNTVGDLEYPADYGRKYLKTQVVTYTIPRDVTAAFQWLEKSVKKDNSPIFDTFKPSVFAEVINEGDGNSPPLGCFVNKYALWELSNMYKKGIGVKKDRKIANQLSDDFSYKYMFYRKL